MTDRSSLIAQLAASFPAAKVGIETISVYVRALADIPIEELEPVAHACMLEGEWFPTLRELRRAVIEARLQLPRPDDAWEAALIWADTPPTVACPAGCNRGVVAGDGVPLDRSLIPADSIFREQLERIADAAAQPTALCPTCEGQGSVPNPARRPLPAPVRRALDHIGGRAGIAEADSLSVVRAQFLKAYERAREDSLRNENLGSANLQLETTRRQPAIEGGDSRGDHHEVRPG